MFTKGDLIIKRYSKAKKLKSKIFKVLAVNTSYKRYQVVNAFGKQKEISQWNYVTLDEDIVEKERAVSTARRNLNNAIEVHQTAQKEAQIAHKYFPTVI